MFCLFYEKNNKRLRVNLEMETKTFLLVKLQTRLEIIDEQFMHSLIRLIAWNHGTIVSPPLRIRLLNSSFDWIIYERKPSRRNASKHSWRNRSEVLVPWIASVCFALKSLTASHYSEQKSSRINSRLMSSLERFRNAQHNKTFSHQEIFRFKNLFVIMNLSFAFFLSLAHPVSWMSMSNGNKFKWQGICTAQRQAAAITLQHHAARSKNSTRHKNR